VIVIISAPFLWISVFFDWPPAGLEMRLDNAATHLLDRHSDNAAAHLADAQSECKEAAKKEKRVIREPALASPGCAAPNPSKGLRAGSPRPRALCTLNML
jgi:hypothetical protein